MNKEQIFNTVSGILTTYLRLNQGEVVGESHIVNDLGADSLAMVELGFQFSEAFGIPMMNPTEENMVIRNLVGQIETMMQRQ